MTDDQEDRQMARMADVRAQYTEQTVTTTPERLVTMLYDRLVRDLVAAEQAIANRDREGANTELVHAQAVVFELFGGLNVDAWAGAPQLANLYLWIIQRLVHANAGQDVAIVRECRELIEPLADAWHSAVGQLAAGRGSYASPTGALGAAV